MNSDFEPPPQGWLVLATVGGVVTAIALIAGLEYWSGRLPNPQPNSYNLSPSTPHQLL